MEKLFLERIKALDPYNSKISLLQEVTNYPISKKADEMASLYAFRLQFIKDDGVKKQFTSIINKLNAKGKDNVLTAVYFVDNIAYQYFTNEDVTELIGIVEFPPDPS